MELPRLDDLYRDSILDHRRNPRNSDKLDNATIIGDSVNPFCGDEIHLQVDLDADGRVERVGLQSEGCSINQAAGSMLTEAVVGKTLYEIDHLVQTFKLMMQGDSDAETRLSDENDLKSLIGVRNYPVRIKCALLSWSALEDGVLSYRRSSEAG
ncbi:SUF system NifU family Fe-S cluster assembly protein [bacterium]|nr:SUF system NifU family Fe-S cluster assembly protein [bacterium]